MFNRKYREENIKLKQDLDRMADKYHSMSNALCDAQDDRDLWRNKASALKAESLKNFNRCTELETQVEAARHNLARMDQTLGEVQEERDLLEAKLAAERVALETARGERDYAEKMVAKLTHELEAAKAELACVHEHAKAMEAQACETAEAADRERLEWSRMHKEYSRVCKELEVLRHRTDPAELLNSLLSQAADLMGDLRTTLVKIALGLSDKS